MLITGTITNKDGEKLNDVYVALMNSQFEEIVSTLTNENGEYRLVAQDTYYPFMVAVKEYKENYLEFWCQNIYLTKDININASIDKLEIYGLHCFRINGAYPALTVYFRAMSLAKYNLGESDLTPNITNDSINLSINNVDVKVLNINRVEEYCGEDNMTAYLMQVSLPETMLRENENLLDVQIRDLDGFFGQASIFF